MKKDDEQPDSQNQGATELKQTYSSQVIDHWQHPRNLGKLERANGHAGGRGPCGDSMWMWIQVADDESIRNATFISDVCIGAVSCGSILTEMIVGMDVRQVMQIGPAMVRKALGGLPEKESHCADLAVKTLKDAIRNYHELRSAGWKQLYQP